VTAQQRLRDPIAKFAPPNERLLRGLRASATTARSWKTPPTCYKQRREEPLPARGFGSTTGPAWRAGPYRLRALPLEADDIGKGSPHDPRHLAQATPAQM